MNDVQIERLISAAEKLADAFQRLASVSEGWYADSKPPVYEGVAEVFKVGDPHQEPQSKAEYRDFPGDGPGRFQTIIDKAHKTAES